MSIEFMGQAARVADGKVWVVAQNYHDLISDGKIPRHFSLHKFGHNAAVGTTEEIVWTNGNGYTYFSTGEKLQVSSDDTQDDSGGTGALTVTLFGLDDNYDEISETVTMNGTAAVETSKTYLRVFRAKVVTAGTNEANVGLISIKNNADTVQMAEIVESRGQTEMAIWTVPADHTLFITRISIGEANNKKCHVPLYVRDNTIANPSWQLKNENVVNLSDISVNLSVPLRVTEKSDVEFRANAATSGGDVNVHFEGYYEA